MGTSVVRALRIIELLAGSEQPVPLSGIVASLGAPKSSVHLVLQDLLAEGFVELSEHGSYVIGMRAFEVSAALLRRSNVVNTVAAELATLTRRLRITSHYAVLAETDVIYLWKEDPPVAAVQLASAVGARLPAQWTAVGKACLAWMDSADVDAHVDLAAQSAGGRVRTRAELAVELAEVRSRGYAIDDGDILDGVTCIAAPVFDLTSCCGAVGVSFLERAGPAGADVAAEVVATAQRATVRIGGSWSR